jgi:hypothetical protein
LPLRGADLVLMAQHARWTRAGSSNNTVMIVELDGPVDTERVRHALERFVAACPWPASRLRRPFPWGALHWTRERGAPLPSVRAVRRGDLHREIEAELNRAIDPRREPPLRILVVDHTLVVTWYHPLMDPRGGQNLLIALARLDAGIDTSPCTECASAFVPAAHRQPLRDRAREARRSLQYMRTLAPVSPVSPGTGISAPGCARFVQSSFVEPAGAPGETRSIAWRLAVVGKAMTALWRRRKLPDVPFLLPISVDLRPSGAPGPVFGNLLAFHFARFDARDTADVPALARHLRRQMAEAMRDGQIDANTVAMEFLRYRPVGTMLHALPWTRDGELFSFNCADIAEFPSGGSPLFGRRVLNGYHVPAVLPRPGIGVFFNRANGLQNAVVSWIDGAASADDAGAILDIVRAELGWRPAA